MQIRPYTDSDQAACLAIFESIDGDFFAEQESKHFQKWLFRALDDQLANYYVIEKEGKLVGCGGFVLNPTKKEAVLAWGMIHTDHQGKGYGEALLNFRIDEIRRRMPEGKIITLDTTQRTYPFFKKLGFQVTKVQEGYHREDLHRYDMEMAF
jgi:N-acetylglutamate synthase-like GNAT family acetyltransferase